ncbi:MAG: sulfotransferase [Pseudomonadales bacterium]
MAQVDQNRVWTFRDAGQLPMPLRLLNSIAGVFPAFSQLQLETIVSKATDATGLSDFGGEEWREGLQCLVDAINGEDLLTPFGAMTERGLFQSLLEQRLRLIDYAKQHPEITEEKIEAPIIVLGLPRTGTTLLSYLLDLDPQSRSLMSWESMEVIPPASLAGRHTDDRIARLSKQEAQLSKLIPPMPAMHPQGATQPTECIPLLMMDFRSQGFETQFLATRYGAWMDQCDMSSAYKLHKLALQTLQSTIPTNRWALKTPQHLWSLDALLETYPDARLIWTHRDPSKVVPSVASLNMAFYRTFSHDPDPVEVAEHWRSKLLLGVERGMDFDKQSDNSNWCMHLHYSELMREPIEAVRGIYQQMGEELDPLHEKRMRIWMQTRPKNTYGTHRYDLADFNLTAEQINEQFGAYINRFDVSLEH